MNLEAPPVRRLPAMRDMLTCTCPACTAWQTAHNSLQSATQKSLFYIEYLELSINQSLLGDNLSTQMLHCLHPMASRLPSSLIILRGAQVEILAEQRINLTSYRIHEEDSCR